MNLPARNLRVLLSLMLAITVTSLFTLRAYAAGEVKAPASETSIEALLMQDCTGTLTVKGGNVTLNGNATQTGATVTNGSVIATGDNGSVIIDLGALGRIELGHHTTATIDGAGGMFHVRTSCGGRVEIENRAGQVNVTVPKTESIAVGKDETYDSPAEFTATGGSSVKIECNSRKAGGLLVGPGLVGILALIGVGAAVAAGVTLSESESSAVGRAPVSGS